MQSCIDGLQKNRVVLFQKLNSFPNNTFLLNWQIWPLRLFKIYTLNTDEYTVSFTISSTASFSEGDFYWVLKFH